MKKLKLPLEIPPVYGYLHHAYNLHVAQQHPSFAEWFYCNYIQLRFYPKNNWLNFERLSLFGGILDYCPLIEYQIMNSNMMEINQLNLIDFAVNCIKHGYYVWLFIDEYYDPNRIAYQKQHVHHENFLYGYDLSQNRFYSAGFDREGSYSFTEISFTDLLKAFHKVKKKYPLKILKPNREVTYTFDRENAKILLWDYLNSGNTSERNRLFTKPSMDFVYGVSVYPYIKSYFESISTGKTISDIRLIHIFLEHKKCMAARVKFLIEAKRMNRLQPVYEACQGIEKKAAILRDLQLRYNITKSNALIDKIIAALDEIRAQEVEALTILLEALS